MLELFSLFSPTKTAPPQEKLFSHVEAGKQLYLRNNTTYEHQTCTNVLLRTWSFLRSPYHRPSLYWVTLKANNIRQNSLFCQRGKDPGQNLSTPLSEVVMVTKLRYGIEGS